MKIYCDTSCLPHNIRGSGADEELAALRELAEKFHLFGSDLVRQEIMNTKDETKRNSLIIDFQALRPVPKDKIIHGASHTEDPYGGFVTFLQISDTSDDALRDKLVARGLGREDAAHLTHAITNGCDVFLTRDKKTIIKPHGEWLESDFPNLKVWRPSQLLEFVQTAVGP